MKTTPPRFFLHFFRWFCHPDLKKYVEGDLMEFYEERRRVSGKRRADWNFAFDVLLLFRPGIIRPKSTLSLQTTMAMLRNYLIITFRNMKRHKGYATLNIAGFALGIAACILILLFVSYEKSFDNFQTKNIYKLDEVQDFPGMEAAQKVGLSMFPMGPTITEEFPEITNFTRVWGTGQVKFEYGEKDIYYDQMLIADTSFFSIFDFPLIAGDRKTALLNPKSIVLTQSAAAKFFGSEDPLGKTIGNYEDDTLLFKVTGILKDIPQNSQFQMDGIVSANTFIQPNWSNNWGGNWLYTYLELARGTNPALLEKKFPDYLKRHMNGDNYKYYTLFLQPLKEVHAGSSDIGLDQFNYQKFDAKYTNMFLAIALVILLIASINFMNLSTARSAERGKEVGIRKSIGSQRWQLSGQFIFESILLTLMATVLAIGLVYLALPFARSLTGRQLDFSLLNNGKMLLMLVGGGLGIGVLSGLYPAMVLSSYRPASVLKGQLKSGKGSLRFRNTLVIVQFSAAIFLMINTIFAVNQLHFMETRDPGFDRDQVVDVELQGHTDHQYETMKKELLANSMISAVTASQDILGSHLDQSGIQFKGDGPLRRLTSTRLIVDPDYLKLFGMKLAEGRNFSGNPANNGREYIINEELAKELLSDTPDKPISSLLGAQFGFDSLGTIVGIVNNFNFNSMHNRIETMFLFSQTDWGYSHMSVKINSAKAADAIALVKKVWEENCGDQPFSYQFLDDHFAEVYRGDAQVSQVVSVLTGLAFIISCLGLFGLSSHAAERRVKEVGIRKVMGASVQNIIGMLSRDFLKYVIVAALISLPLAWLVVKQWLSTYAFRINMDLCVFVATALAALMIALLTTIYQAIRAATQNPVNSLRSE